MREQGWLAQAPFGYMVLDREAGEFFLRTRSAIFPGMKIAEIFGVTEGPLYEQMQRNILHVNGARPLAPAQPREPGALAARGRALPAGDARVPRRADAGCRRGGAATGGEVRCDFVEAFAKPYPSQVIASVMGAPLEDAPRLHHWSNWIQRQFDAGSMASEKDKIEQAVEEFYEYAEALLRARRADPGDDLISMLIAAEEEGERLSDVECINLVFNILAGGVDTTQSQLAHAIRLLAEHPEQWRLLAERPELAGAAVEEALRYEPITPFTARILTEEVVYRDVTFPQDTVVMVCAFTGNRDLDGATGTGRHGGRRRRCRTTLRHHRRPRPRAAADVRRRRALLPRREPRAAGDAGGAAFLVRAHATSSRSTASRCSDGVSGIYGLDELPVRFTFGLSRSAAAPAGRRAQRPALARIPIVGNNACETTRWL